MHGIVWSWIGAHWMSAQGHIDRGESSKDLIQSIGRVLALFLKWIELSYSDERTLLVMKVDASIEVSEFEDRSLEFPHRSWSDSDSKKQSGLRW